MKSREAAIREKATYVKQEFEAIMLDLFGNVGCLNAFIEQFNTTFTQYQDSNKRKFDPASVREGKVSCSSATALIAIWLQQQFPGIEPVFLIENIVCRDLPRTSAHISLGVPLDPEIDAMTMYRAFENRNDYDRSKFRLLDWTQKSLLKEVNPAQAYPVRVTTSLDAYLHDRIGVFGLKKSK